MLKIKQKEAQSHKEKVTLWGKDELEFPYLGHWIQADGDDMHAIEVRLGFASSRFKQLHHIWSDVSLPLKLRLQLYTSSVVSILTHSFEAWKLTDAVIRKLRGWNGRCLAIIVTGKCEQDEIKLQTSQPVFNLVNHLRVRRLRWLGHILRLDESRLLRRVLLKFNFIYPDGYPEGSILMDAPDHVEIRDLIPMAGEHGNHEEWDKIVFNLKRKLETFRA